MNFEGKVAVSSGAASGMGLLFAQNFASLGGNDVPIDVYDWGIDVNLKGPFYFAHAVLKQMREQKSGLIINIGSITGAEGDSYGMDYPTYTNLLLPSVFLK